MTAVHLRRIDATRNMRRFSRLEVQPDIFGGVLLVKEWERVGALRVHVARQNQQTANLQKVMSHER